MILNEISVGKKINRNDVQKPIKVSSSWFRLQ